MTVPDIAIVSALSLAAVASAVLAVGLCALPVVAVLSLVGALLPVWGVVSLLRERR